MDSSTRQERTFQLLSAEKFAERSEGDAGWGWASVVVGQYSETWITQNVVA